MLLAAAQASRRRCCSNFCQDHSGNCLVFIDESHVTVPQIGNCLVFIYESPRQRVTVPQVGGMFTLSEGDFNLPMKG
jgi:excinuclease UvrABC helicase subunit UvrB